MNIKRNIILILIALFACTCITIFAFGVRSKVDIDVVAVNDVVQTLIKQWDVIDQKDDIEQWDQSDLPGMQYGFDYVVIDKSGNLIAATRGGLNEDINSAIRHWDTIVDINRDNETIGKLFIYNNSSDRLEQYRSKLLSFVLFILVTTAFLCIIYAIYYDRTIFRPFRKLQSFARHVTEGNLDMPLDMDKDNVFGAFTESFDLMREEINRARINERMANQSKRELVASLSHDIKTPVASIKAVSELIYARSTDDTLKKQIDIIDSKADQINTLITNLFNATLEELQELKVTVTEQSSRLLFDLIKKADYNNQVTISKICECLILIDELRLAQVIDNVISNSYKYADTSIEVSTQMKGRYLEVVFKDFGLGVPEEERPLIFNKFYRAKNSVNKNGTGLGLYISKYIMNKMLGEIDCENTEDGFIMILKLKMV
jgi:signal transduction histidine kinase